jgi:peptidylprolyl isomerase
MKQVENGKFVKVSYTGRFDDGEIFDKSDDFRPLEVQIGAGEVVPGFESALLGMSLSEKKTFTIPPDQAYGERNEEMERKMPRSSFPPELDPQIGEMLAFRTSNGGQIPGAVKEKSADHITVDFNHPLAGKALTFDVEVLEINDRRTASACSCSSTDCSSGCGSGPGSGCGGGGCC